MAKAVTNELKLTRVYDAPIQAVWDAWNDPEQAAQWWGPRGFTITTHSKDLRVGGHWHYTMHGPDGTDYENKTKYFEVEENAKLVYDHGGSDTRKPLFRVTVLFSEVNGQTKLDFTMTLPTPQAAEETRLFIKKAGGNGTWDRLAEYLEKQSSGDEVFIINRSFDCSVEKMFDLWTNPQHLAQWLPPVGMTMQFIDANLREGGTSFYVMSGNDMTFYGKLYYLKIQRPSFLEYTQMFCDEKGNISRHPKAPTWPELMHTTVLLTPEGADQTRVTVRWQPDGKTTPDELAAFVQMRAGMTQGWTGSFDKLEAMVGS
jgi:uncharacterized protein YndB with AHSA1/START domain